MHIDPVDYAVISQALQAIAKEMGTKLVRSAYSTIVREARDASAAILDSAGNVIAQAEMIPLHLGSMGITLRACLEQFPANTLDEGDFLVNNHPYHGGQHLQDLFIYSPIVVDGEVVAFAGTTAHHVEMGGSDAGINNSATDLYQEGLLFPPVRMNYARDWNGGSFQRILSANVRVPTQTIGDVNAQFSANAIGGERFTALCARYGVATVKQVMQSLTDYTEARMRTAIRALPDGEYFGEDAMDNDGRSDKPVWVRTKVTIAGDQMTVSFEGTDPQVDRNLNSPYASTLSSVMSCIKGVLLDSDVPFNEGGFRPVTIHVPEGTVLNPRFPAPVRARMEICYRAYDAVMKALSSVIPEQTIASGFDAILAVCLTRKAEGRYGVCIETYGGGFGAGAENDGADGVAQPLSNTTNSPVEALDMEYDYFRVVSYGLREGSNGQGKHRGGLGIVRTYEILRDGVEFSLYGDRFVIQPQGIHGGTSASRATATVITNGVRRPVDLHRPDRLQKGDLVEIATSGGAGYGDPLKRPHDVVANDIVQGYLSPELASAHYGHTGTAA